LGLAGTQAFYLCHHLLHDIGEYDSIAGTDLQASAQCPDLSRYCEFAGIDLPAEAFGMSGRLGDGGESLVLQGWSARLGENSAAIKGHVRLDDEHVELDLQLDIEGPDLSRITSLAGIDGIPAAPYRAVGTIGIHSDGWHLSEVRAQAGGMTLEAEGTVIPGSGLLGSELRLRFAGPDSSYPAALAGLDGVPPEAFSIEGAIRVVENGYALDSVEAEVGSIMARIDGHLGPPPALLGTTLRVDGRGESLSFFAPLRGGTPLPDVPFEVAGSLAVDEAGCRLDPLEIEIGANRISIAGLLAFGENLAGSDIEFEMGGSDLSETGLLLAGAGVEELPELPAEAFSVTGRVQIDGAGYLLREVVGRIGSGSLRLNGRIGPLPECRGTDLTVLGNGPDANLFTALTGGEIEVAPFQMSGRVERHGADFKFHDFVVRLGEYRAALSGTLGEPPTMAGTDLDFHASGPGLGLPQQIAGLFGSRFRRDLPEKPFEVSGHCRGSPEDLTISGLDVALGESDLHGWFRLDLEGKPRLQGELTSEKIDFVPFLTDRAQSRDPVDSDDPADDRAEAGRLFPDDLIDLKPLDRIDANVFLSARKLLLPRVRYTDVRIGVQLENGGLHLDPVSATGTQGSVLEGVFRVEPADEGCFVSVDMEVEDGLFDLSSLVDETTNWVAMDIDAKFQGAGRSLHEIACATDGFIVLAASEGIVDHTLFEVVSSDILLELLDVLNPFHNEEPETRLKCSVIVMNIDNGLVSLDPLVMQTEKTSMTGLGEIDLSTEEFELRWVTKPCTGLGLNAGMVTDNYVRLGGTLTEPHLEVMPLRAAVSTGLVIGTSGLYLVIKALWNRITSYRNVCKDALEEAEHQRVELDRGHGND